MYTCTHASRCNFYRFLINPSSFTQTVENMFDMGFLIKDGDVDMSIQDGEPILRYMSTAQNDRAFQEGGRPMMQNVMRYNMRVHEVSIGRELPRDCSMRCLVM